MTFLSKTWLGVAGARTFQLKMSSNAIASASKLNRNPNHRFSECQFGKMKMMKLFSSSFSTGTRTCTAANMRAPTTNDTDASINKTNPLSKLKDMAIQKKLCDPDGFCLPNTHWSFVLSGNNDDEEMVSAASSIVHEYFSCKYFRYYYFSCSVHKDINKVYIINNALIPFLLAATQYSNSQLFKGLRRGHILLF